MPAAMPARRTFGVFVVACVMALSLVATLSSPVRAATFTVNSLGTVSDSNPGDGVCDSEDGCTLPAAIEEANALASNDIVNVPAGTYALSAQLFVAANGSLTITGDGAPTTIIDLNANDRVLQLEADSVVRISGMTIRDGAAGDGAGIDTDARVALSLDNSVVSGNVAVNNGGGISLGDDASAILSGTTVSGNSAGYGAGIFVSDGASLALIDGSSVSGNGSEAEPAQRGGGINNSGDVTVTGGSVTANYGREGGGIFNTSDGTITFVGGSLSGNFAIDADNEGVYGFGAGIYSAGPLTFTNSTISGNAAVEDGGGVLVATGEVTVTGTTISGNTSGDDGGGIWSAGQVGLLNSTISGNTSGGDGGGIWSAGQVGLLNSTISGNSASLSPDDDEFDGRGGGIWSSGDVDLEFVTVAFNTADRAGGIWVATGDVHLFASIVANNTGTDPQDDANCFGDDGDVDSEGNNLSSDATCDLDQASDKPNMNPLLGVLANNGGPTQTHALLTGSPAIDAALVVSPATCPGFDQRGVVRPQDGDSNGVAVCDIGAYELVPSVISINDVSVTEGNSGTVDAVFTVTLSAASPSTVTAVYATANGTATVVADYQAAAGTVTFLPGDTSETITVRVVGDTIDEPNETFFVNLTVPVGGTIADAQGTGTILDDEGPIVTPTPAAGQLPDTGTADTPLNGWGAPGLAIAIAVFSAAALVWNRRRQAAGAR